MKDKEYHANFATFVSIFATFVSKTLISPPPPTPPPQKWINLILPVFE